MPSSGYKQELDRGWSRFSNFAISFTIISVLAGCFTTYPQAWNLGGPIAISWGWPIVVLLILPIAFSMAEVAAAYPTAGGPYWWANDLGGPVWSWFTGWFNLLGLVAIVASVDWFCAQFFTFVFNLWGLDFILNFADSVSLGEIFIVFMVILVLHAMINIFSSHLVALFNNISVFWHCVGVLIIIGILIVVPDHHQSADFVFTEKINNSGFSDGHVLVVHPAHRPAPDHVHGHGLRRVGARGGGDAGRRGLGGQGRLAVGRALRADRLVRAPGDHLRGERRGRGQRRRRHLAGDLPERDVRELGRGRDPDLGDRAVLLRHGCVTSCSRTFFALSRDRVTPGHRLWASVNGKRGVPVAAVIGSCVLAGILSLPALGGNAAGVPVAFFAVVSIGVIGLYLAYVIPTYLRWRSPERFTPSPAWNLGDKWKWLNPMAVAWVIITSIYFCLPFYGPAAVWWDDSFDWNAANFTPLVLGVLIIAITIAWFAGMNKRYKGPIRTIEFDEGMGITQEKPTDVDEPPAAEPPPAPA